MALDHLALLAVDLDEFADAIEHGPADAPIAGCPGWDLAALGEHLGDVHRWVLGALATGGPPPLSTDLPPKDGLPALAAWVRDGSARLVSALAATDPAAPTWHPFPVEPKLAGLWRRRQAQEASVHRWDAQRAAGLHPTIEPTFAADGVEEYWTVMLPRMLTRERRSAPASTIAVELTDVDRRWVIDGAMGMPVPSPSGRPAAAVLRGDAASMLLHLWGRPTDAAVTVEGDPVVAADWLRLGGA